MELTCKLSNGVKASLADYDSGVQFEDGTTGECILVPILDLDQLLPLMKAASSMYRNDRLKRERLSPDEQRVLAAFFDASNEAVNEQGNSRVDAWHDQKMEQRPEPPCGGLTGEQIQAIVRDEKRRGG